MIITSKRIIASALTFVLMDIVNTTFLCLFFTFLKMCVHAVNYIQHTYYFHFVIDGDITVFDHFLCSKHWFGFECFFIVPDAGNVACFPCLSTFYLSLSILLFKVYNSLHPPCHKKDKTAWYKDWYIIEQFWRLRYKTLYTHPDTKRPRLMFNKLRIENWRAQPLPALEPFWSSQMAQMLR